MINGRDTNLLEGVELHNGVCKTSYFLLILQFNKKKFDLFVGFNIYYFLLFFVSYLYYVCCTFSVYCFYHAKHKTITKIITFFKIQNGLFYED